MLGSFKLNNLNYEAQNDQNGTKKVAKRENGKNLFNILATFTQSQTS